MSKEFKKRKSMIQRIFQMMTNTALRRRYWRIHVLQAKYWSIYRVNTGLMSLVSLQVYNDPFPVGLTCCFKSTTTYLHARLCINASIYMRVTHQFYTSAGSQILPGELRMLADGTYINSTISKGHRCGRGNSLTTLPLKTPKSLSPQQKCCCISKLWLEYLKQYQCQDLITYMKRPHNDSVSTLTHKRRKILGCISVTATPAGHPISERELRAPDTPQVQWLLRQSRESRNVFKGYERRKRLLPHRNFGTLLGKQGQDDVNHYPL